MNELEKTILFNDLLSIYGDLLTTTQKEILTDYYCVNLSLSEIADERGVSRSAVEDAIKKGNKKLLEYENKLEILKKQKNIRDLLENLKSKCKDNELLSIIEDIERSI